MTETEICWDWHMPIPCCVKIDATILENILTASKADNWYALWFYSQQYGKRYAHICTSFHVYKYIHK